MATLDIWTLTSIISTARIDATHTPVFYTFREEHSVFRHLAVCIAAAVALSFGNNLLSQAAEIKEKPASELTVEQARREVRLVDDIYKTAIVFMNDVYVVDENSVAAGDTARHLFEAIKAKGWHEARLIAATDDVLNDENVPTGNFEKAAIKKIKKGETYYDEVVTENGKKYLRAATLVPVVNEKCILCHPGNKVGDVLGAISYRIPLN